MTSTPHKSGFVNILGKPNVGKSTLMNALVGEKLSIITSKAQTTRHRILGIVNGDDFQIVFSDTPGIIKPAYKLHESMMKFVKTSLKDADIILKVIDATDDRTSEADREIDEKLNKIDVPIFLIINKVDLVDQEKQILLINKWKDRLNAAEIIPVSALKKINVDVVFDSILKLLPECPPYYPKDSLTDKAERFFVSEIIREKIFNVYQQEVPYSTDVDIEVFDEDEKIIRIRAIIYVDRKSQKPIIIGKKGSAIKRVGINARVDIETFLDKKVYLELFVKVKENWRNDPKTLKNFGY